MRCAPKAVFVAALVSLMVLPGLALAAKNKPRAEQKPVMEEKATQVLEKTCQALANLKDFSFSAEVTLDRVHQDGSKIQAGRVMQVTVQRPGAFRVVTVGDDFQATSVFDGKTFTIALPERKAYGQIPAAMDTDALMEMLAATYGIESPLGDLLASDACAKMNPVSGFYVGKARVDGVVCDHLFFQGRDVDWQIWVEDGPAGLPRKMVITEKKLPMAPQFAAVLSVWKTVQSPAETFTFAPPADFTRDDAVITGVKSGK